MKQNHTASPYETNRSTPLVIHPDALSESDTDPMYLEDSDNDSLCASCAHQYDHNCQTEHLACNYEPAEKTW